jgi:triacylglycerol lipase
VTTVVLVSGGAAVTPFTTPTAAAGSGLAAGNSMTAIREHLLAAGHEVFTAPARIGAGTVTEDAGWQGFADVPEVLPAEVTVNSVGRIDAAGAAVAGFVRLLADRHPAGELAIVGHSMGGLFARATRRMRAGTPRPRRSSRGRARSRRRGPRARPRRCRRASSTDPEDGTPGRRACSTASP